MSIKIEHLPFTIRIAETEEDILKAIEVRQSAYGRHLPELAARMGAPDQADLDGSAVILLAESKLDGSALGTMRIHTNELKALPVEGSVSLPAQYRGCRLAEATRLGVEHGRVGSAVKTYLFKSLYVYCATNDVDWIVITARPPLDRMYQAILYKDVFEGGPYIPMAHVGNVPHRVMAYHVEDAPISPEAKAHPLYDTFFRTLHPDINLTGRPNVVRQPRPVPYGRTEPLHA
ncbi:MAG TPA: hypothetical protein PK375_03120 [Rhodocyclaceae bacterium]|nr:hypothetical protein [Rhodocyclaceae bacterium]